MTSKQLNILSKFDSLLLDKPYNISFLNFASVGSYLKSGSVDIKYFADGMLLAKFIQMFSGRKIERVSFDFTSIADIVFTSAVKYKKRIYFVGAEQSELDLFCEKILKKYPGIIISGSSNGYFSKDHENCLYRKITQAGTDILVVGLGAGKQDDFISNLRVTGFQGTSFTCGGFIRQESSKTSDYYPKLINKLKLRAFYRMYKEPHTIKRYFLDYPVNAFILLKLMITRGLKINVL